MPLFLQKTSHSAMFFSSFGPKQLGGRLSFVIPSGILPSHKLIVAPITLQPFCFNKSAVKVESTPPDIPITTVSFFSGIFASIYFMLGILVFSKFNFILQVLFLCLPVPLLQTPNG